MNKPKKSLTKEEVLILLNLIEANKIITSKVTNARSNSLKEEAWKVVTHQFNNSISSYPRTTEQLKLKWDNLKKSARKRIHNIKMGEEVQEILQHDQCLDKVASILRSSSAVTDGGNFNVIMIGDDDSSKTIAWEPETVMKTKSDTPVSNTSKPKTLKMRHNEIMSRITRNKNIADYYLSKKKQVEEELTGAKEKLNLELTILDMQKKKLELEIEELKSKKLVFKISTE